MTTFEDIVKDVADSNLTQNKGIEKATALFIRQVNTQKTNNNLIATQQIEQTNYSNHVTNFTDALASRSTANIPVHLREPLAEYVTQMGVIANKIKDLLR